MGYEIVTDSSATLSVELLKEFNVHVLPLSYMDVATGVQKKIDVFDESFSFADFYNNMRNDVVYTTSLPNLADSRAELVEILERGNDIFYIGFDSAISGTCESTSALMDDLAAEYPDRKLLHIDTLTAAGAEGLLVYYACRMHQNGASIDEVFDWVKENMWKVDAWFTVEDLKYLVRGGRLSKFDGFAGSVLNIKPILRVSDDGSLQAIEKVRGRKKALRGLIDQFGKNHAEIDDDFVVSINHADSLEDAEYVKNAIAEKYGVKNFFIEWLDPVVGAHTGPGLIVLCYPCTSRD